ncbi:FCD domain-containing protein, partial [Nocardiopsis alba]|uniref:FCD domain-containing protein n=1 Tax=Nocardiopsis alba TaxID=53437 RepID=UPI003400E25B
LGATAQEHHDLLDLIEAREVSGAEELMRRHLGPGPPHPPGRGRASTRSRRPRRR